MHIIFRLGLSAAAVLSLVIAVLLPAGCGSKSDTNAPGGRTKIKVAYLGLTCEAPIFVAYEKGLFAEEGLDAELVKTDWNGLSEGLGLGTFDANHTLIMFLLKPIEQGSPVKITGGIHTGCLRVQAGIKTDIKSIKDLKGKKIAAPTRIGSPPYMFGSRVLAANDIDPRPDAKQVDWTAVEPGEMEKALENGTVDAICTSDPIGTILLGRKKVRTLADQAIDAPYADEYCCASVVSGKLAKENPAAAAKVTRALLKASKWVGENTKAASDLSVEKKYLASTAEINYQALSKLKYIPGVNQCKKSINQAAYEMKRCGLLKDSTDPEALSKRAWLDLDGVSDEWLADVKVDKIAGAGRAKILDPVAFAALFDGKSICCNCCCLNK